MHREIPYGENSRLRITRCWFSLVSPAGSLRAFLTLRIVRTMLSSIAPPAGHTPSSSIHCGSGCGPIAVGSTRHSWQLLFICSTFKTRYAAPGQILTISNHGRSWTLRNVRKVWPRSEAGFFGPGDGAGARRRQRKALVDGLRTGWGEFERLPEGYPCPWDLELEFLGPLDRLEAHEG